MYVTDDQDAVLARFIYLGRQLVALHAPAGGSYYYHFDKTGSTVAVTDASGDVAAAYAYAPYGRKTAAVGSIENPFTFVGAWGVVDDGSGLYYMRHRHYHAGLRRFMQRDPIGFLGGINLYGYVGGNPVERIDPEGTEILTAVGAVIVVGGLALYGASQVYSAGKEAWNDLTNTVKTEAQPGHVAEVADPAEKNFDPDYGSGYVTKSCKAMESSANLGKEIYNNKMGALGDAIDIANAVDDYMNASPTADIGQW